MKFSPWKYHIILSTLFLAACSKTEPGVVPSPVTPEQVEIAAEIGDAVSKTDFLEGDQIGVYQVHYTGGTPGTLGDIAFPMNVRYTYGSAIWKADAGRELFLNDVDADLYAYYPYDPEMSATLDKSNLGAYPFTIEQDQLNNHCDFLWSKVSGLNYSNNKAQMVFSHLMSKVIINVRYGETNTSEPDFTIHNTRLKCLVDLRSGIVTADGDQTDPITPRPLEQPTDGYDLTYEAVIAPQILEAGTPLFTLVNNNIVPIYFLDSDTEFLPQYSYTFNLIVETISVRGGAGYPVSVERIEELK